MKAICAGAVAALMLFATQAGAVTAIDTAGASIFVASTGDVTVTYDGFKAMYLDQLSLVGRSGALFTNGTTTVGTTVDLGTFTAGTELIFSLYNPGTKKTYYTGPASRNPDNATHATAQPNGYVYVGFEDLSNPGSDWDYNDLTFHVSNATTTGAVPEPATWAMLMSGFGLVGAAARRRNTRVVQAI